MPKNKLMEAYEKTEKKWSKMGIRAKANKIKDYLMSLEPKSPAEKESIDNQLLMIKELDPVERRKVIEHIHSNIMKSIMKATNSIKN